MGSSADAPRQFVEEAPSFGNSAKTRVCGRDGLRRRRRTERLWIGLTDPRTLSNLRTFVRQQNVPLTYSFRSACSALAALCEQG